MRFTTCIAALVILACSANALEHGEENVERSSRVKRRAIPSALLIELAQIMGQAFISNLNAGSFVISQPEADSLWISASNGSWGTWKGQVVSCFYHPTKKHSATTVGKNGTKRSVANAKKWACSMQTRDLWGNRTYWNTL